MCGNGPGEFFEPQLVPRKDLIRHRVHENKKGHLKVTLCILARPTRFERVTPAFGGQISIELNIDIFML